MFDVMPESQPCASLPEQWRGLDGSTDSVFYITHCQSVKQMFTNFVQLFYAAIIRQKLDVHTSYLAQMSVL